MARKITKKQNDYYITPAGFSIPVADVERFRRNVRAINKRAERQMKKWINENREIDAVKTNQTVGQLMTMGYRPEFAYAKRTQNLGQFTSKAQFYKRLEATERALQPGYIDARVKRYKNNYCSSLQQHFGDDSAELQMRIQSMDQDTFIRKITTNPDQLSIKAVYHYSRMAGGLAILSRAWGFDIPEYNDNSDYNDEVEE